MTLNVVEFPRTHFDTEKQLRSMADEVASGEFGPNPHVVCVISSEDSFQVRGLGKADSLIAIALLNLGAGWLVQETLGEMDE